MRNYFVLDFLSKFSARYAPAFDWVDRIVKSGRSERGKAIANVSNSPPQMIIPHVPMMTIALNMLDDLTAAQVKKGFCQP
jgi:hypothetical protein